MFVQRYAFVFYFTPSCRVSFRCKSDAHSIGAVKVFAVVEPVCYFIENAGGDEPCDDIDKIVCLDVYRGSAEQNVERQDAKHKVAVHLSSQDE